MSKYSRFLYKAQNKADLSGLRAGIKLIVMILVVVYSLVGMNPITASAAGLTYYVNNTVPCNDLSSDTSTVPFCTISRGGVVARSGDTVRVLAGNYAETVSISTWSGTLGNPITFSAAPGVTMTTGTTSAFRVFGLHYITIDGFTVNSANDYGMYVSGDHFIISNNHVSGTPNHGIYVIDSNNITISNNHVSNSGGSGIYLKNAYASTVNGNTSDHNNPDGIRLTSCYTVTVSNNTTFANGNNGIAAIGTIPLPSYSNTILHNIAYANVDSGLQFDTGSHDNSVLGNLSYNNGDHGIDNNTAPNQTIVGNTFQGNYTSGINLEASSTGATVVNNILVDNGLAPSVGKPYNIYVDSTSFTGTTLDYNLYYLNAPYNQQIWWNTTGYTSLADFKTAVPTQEVNGLQGNPLFVAPATPATDPPSVVMGDYHLTVGSPAIDSANAAAPGEPTTDIEGSPRVNNDDRGAYEFQPGGVTAPTVTTQAVTGITTTTATGNGNVTALGVPNPTQHGVAWGTSANPTIAGNKTTDGAVGATGPFTSAITGLTPGTQYHVRAYATNTAGTSYGGDVSFTALQVPTVTTQAVTGITTTTATGNGNVTALGVPNPTQHGVVWSTSANPTIPGTQTNDGPVSATGAFTSTITGLTPGTLYHVRAYATNAAGTSYGGDVTFTALKVPTVTTQAVTSIGTTTATGNGNVTDLGVPNPTQHGVVWSTSANPTIPGTQTNDGPVSATGAFTSAITGLTPNTPYHVRAYATNTAGTVYGGDVAFTTSPMVDSTTTVNCGAGTPIVTYGSSITCVATVVRASGSNTPTGNVSWVTSGSGNFITSPCTLSGSGGTATCSVTYTPSSVGTGSHQITATYAGDVNFLTSSGNQIVTVNKKAASVTPNAASKTYGASDPTLSGTLTGFLPADGVTAAYSRIAGETVLGGPYTISAVLSPTGVLANYTITNNTANFTINPKAASVTALNNSKTVGGSDPALSTTNSGFLTGDLGVGKITFSATRASGETVGTYDITPAAADAGTGLLGNYNVTYNHGTFTINAKLIPAVTVACGTNTVTYGNGISCTVTVVRPSGTNTPTGTVAWITGGAGGFGGTTPCTLSPVVSGTATCSVTYTPTAVGTGTHTLTATYSGDANFDVNSGTRDVTVNKANQATLNVVATPSTVAFGNTSALSTTGGSGTGTVTYAAGASTGCSVTGSTLSVTDVSGTCAVTATKAADTNYNAATSAALPVTLTKANQTITFGTLADKTLGDADFSVSATASSGLPVDFSTSTSSVCSVTADGVTVHLVAIGTCTITAHQGGNGNYNAAADVPQSFNVVADIAPVITEGASVGVNMSQDGNPTPFSLTLNATDANGDPITWSVSSPAGHGTAAASGTGPSKAITYTPALNYIGSDSFVVQVSDGRGGTDTITVNVTITAVPTTFTIYLPLILR